jgi:hypothetical protein
MTELATVLFKPANLTNDTATAWFDAVAQSLLNEQHLMVGGEAHRLAEIEFYYYASVHADPFAHRDPVQQHNGRWYFHRSHRVYRGGSFKGIDLAFGDGEAFGGVLFRSLMLPSPQRGRGVGGEGATVVETSNPSPPAPLPQGERGEMVVGPSLLVDHLLARSAAGDVASLDRVIGERLAWDTTSPLALAPSPEPRTEQIFQSARVGLTLRRSKKGDQAVQYIVRNYRYFTEPRRISKGKPHMVVALHNQGIAPVEIARLTGSPKRSIDRYIADFEAGKKEPNFDRYYGKDLTPGELCRLHGTVAAQSAERGTRSGHQ